MSSVKIQGNASGTGIFTISSPNSNTDRTFTLPDAAGEIALTGGSVDETLNTLTLNTGVYLGGVAAQNLLDDYEEGTWTPVSSTQSSVLGSPWTVSNATYTKVGRKVTVHIRFTGTNIGFGTTTGYHQWTGLPFTSAGYQGTGSWNITTVANGTAGSAYVVASGTALWLLAPSNTNTGSTISVTVTYETA